MAVRRILQIENPDDKKILKTRCHPIKTFSPALKQLAADMFETMHAANGVGLAAPQVGITQRIAVIWIPAEVEEREQDVSFFRGLHLQQISVPQKSVKN